MGSEKKTIILIVRLLIYALILYLLWLAVNWFIVSLGLPPIFGTIVLIIIAFAFLLYILRTLDLGI